MQIHGLHQAHTTQSIASPQAASAAGSSESTSSVSSAQADQLDLSPEAQALSETQAAGGTEISGIRHEKVAALRAAIADGSYDTPERLSMALDKMLDTFA